MTDLFEPKTRRGLDTDEVISRLRKKFGPPEYAFMEQVRNGVGFSANRTADAIAMGVWPSRGLNLIGFEVKVSRSDWLREKKKPEKAEDVICYMDRFYLVIGDEAIVKPGELPETWGLIVPRGAGLGIAKEAPKLKPRQIDRSVLAAMLRNMVSDGFDQARIDALTKDLREEHAKALAQVREHAKEHALADYAVLKRRVEEFEEAAGIEIATYKAENMGKAVRLVMDAGLATAPWSIQHGIDAMRSAANNAEAALKAFRTCPEAAKSGGGGSGVGGEG